MADWKGMMGATQMGSTPPAAVLLILDRKERLVSASLTAGLLGLTLLAAPPEEGFTPLFDGKSLAGWEGDAKTFRVEDGVILAGNLEKPIPRNEFLCTRREYGDFELRLKARLTGKGENAGVQFRSQRIPNHHEVVGYQCDIGRGMGRLIWGSLYDESRRRRFLAEGDATKLEDVVKPEGWNDITIRAEGARIRIWVNGYQTVDYVERDEEIPRTGIIGLQIHGGPPAVAAYREIRIRELRREP